MLRPHVHRITSVLAMAAIVLTALAASAEGVAGVRLIVADNTDRPSSAAGLEDVLPMLKNTLRFKSYRLMSEQRTTLRDGATVRLQYGYQVTFSDPNDGQVTARVGRKNEQILRTRLRLQPRRPVVVGGFPHTDATTIIIVISLLGD